jgi:hypothetical protein
LTRANGTSTFHFENEIWGYPSVQNAAGLPTCGVFVFAVMCS